MARASYQNVDNIIIGRKPVVVPVARRVSHDGRTRKPILRLSFGR